MSSSETKKCKFCQSDIAKKATICPQCKKDQRWWFNRHPIFTVLLCLFIVWIVVSSRNPSPTVNSECIAKIWNQQICNDMSEWDWSYKPLVEYVKNNMKDSSSFQHISTTFSNTDKAVIFLMKYSWKNSFNATTTETIKMKIDTTTWDRKIVE